MRAVAVVLLLLVLAACQRGHEVEILLGPTEDTLSVGFLCEGADGQPLILDAAIGGGEYQFAVVVDIITIGDRSLGCRGEELVTACEEETCEVVERACRVVTIQIMAGDTGRTLLDRLRAQLEGFTVVEDAPDSPVIVRVIAVDLAAAQTSATCPAGFTDKDHDFRAEALGCAHSCPVELDNVDQVSVSLDALARQCESVMRMCAGFRS